MRLISWVTPSWTQKLPLAGSWKQKSRIFWSVRLHMKADRNMLVLSFHLLVPYECKMDLQCSSGQTSFTDTGHGYKWLPGLGVSRKQILMWHQFLNSFPFYSPGYQGANWDTSVAHPKPHRNIFCLVRAMLHYGAGDLPLWSLFCFSCLEHHRFVACCNYWVKQ